MAELYVEDFSDIERIMQECVLQSGRESLPPECADFLRELKTAVAPPSRNQQTDREAQAEIRLKREIEELRKHVLESRSTIPTDLSQAMKRNVENFVNESGVDNEIGDNGETFSKDLEGKIEFLKGMLRPAGGTAEERPTCKLQTSLARHQAALNQLQKVRNLFQSDFNSLDTGPLHLDRPVVANTPIVKANLASAAHSLNAS